MNWILEIKDLAKYFDGIRAIDGLSLTLTQNKITSLIGPNGAGKTTLFNVITGFLKPDQGQVFYRGKNITELPSHRISTLGIVRTFQNLRLIKMLSVLDNILLAFRDQKGESLWGVMPGIKNRGAERKNREKAIDILGFLGLADKANDLAEALSYGQQKLLTLACCLATGADLLLLDEPVAGLHPETIDKVLRIIRELSKQGKTIFFIEQHMGAVMDISDWVIVMDEGRKIAEGEPEIIKEDSRVIGAYLT